MGISDANQLSTDSYMNINNIRKGAEKQNTSQRIKESANRPHTSHWKMPDLPAENIEASRSLLYDKMSDLDQLAMQLKLKLTSCDKNSNIEPNNESDDLQTIDINNSNNMTNP